MANSVVIKSVHNGTELELSERSGDYFLARLTGPSFQCTAKVYEYEAARLKEFFSDMAANSRGWSGKREWNSLERELVLAAAIDRAGHISLSVHLRSGTHPFDWKMAATILLEAGQLTRIAHSVEAFVGENNAVK